MTMNDNRIIVDPNICNGKPVIKGTRITVQTILEFLSSGDEIEEILRQYPSLERDDVLACLRFASQLMGHHFIMRNVA
ncbi:MAG: DUF433 domain-containing protein [Candidatus Kapaibacterium sp.]